MDIPKLLEWGMEYFSEYIKASVLTFREPSSIQSSPILKAENSFATIVDKRSVRDSRPSLTKELFGFLIFFIVFGSTLNSLVPNRPPAPPTILYTVFITLLIWLIYSFLTYRFCKILRGSGNLWEETISVTLHLLAPIYLVSNFITWFWGIITLTPFIHNFLKGQNVFFDVIVDQPIALYFIVQFLLMIIYLPLALKNIHNFGYIRQILIGLVPLSISFLAIAPVKLPPMRRPN